MKFKDVAHLYIECLCKVSAQGGEFIEPLIGVKHGTPLIGGIDIDVFAYPNFKPILVSRENLTNTQKMECVYLRFGHVKREVLNDFVQHNIIKLDNDLYSPEEFAYLLSQRVDLFNLIDVRKILEGLSVQLYFTSECNKLFAVSEDADAIAMIMPVRCEHDRSTVHANAIQSFPFLFNH